MLSPCHACGPLHCVLGSRKRDCLQSFPNLRRIANSLSGFSGTEEDPDSWPDFERSYYETRTKGANIMGAPRKAGRPPKINPQAEQLTKALAFVSLVSEDDETLPNNGHVMLGSNMAVVLGRMMSAGHPIVEDLEICPHLDRLKLALARSGAGLTIAKTAGGSLSVSGKKFRALIPTVPQDTMPPIFPDMPVAVVNDSIKEAFKVCGTLATEAGERVIEASLLLEAYVCTGTNGVAMMQYMHGIDLPPHMVISKTFAAAVAKVEAPLTGFGFTWSEELQKPSSITFWFEGGLWLRCNCYSDRWPEIEQIVGAANYPAALPAGLFEAIEAVEKFSDDKEPSVYFNDGKVQSHYTAEAGASFDVPGLQGGKRFKAKLVRQVSPYVTAIDLTTFEDRAFFTGGTPNEFGVGAIRGVLMGMAGAHKVAPASEPQSEPVGTAWGGAEITGDDEPDTVGWGGTDAPATAPWGSEEPQATGWGGEGDSSEIDTDVPPPNVGWGG